MKSMDSIYAMNGKSVEVDNTDAEGRLILSGSYGFECNSAPDGFHQCF
jgi:leucyl aminopeptidase